MTTGAQNDLERVTQLAYSMITLYGMNDKIGNISFNDNQGEFNLKKPYSEEMASEIDKEARKIIDTSYERIKQLLVKHMDKLEIVAQTLLKKEVIFRDDLEGLIGERPWTDPDEEAAKEEKKKSEAANPTGPPELPKIDSNGKSNGTPAVKAEAGAEAESSNEEKEEQTDSPKVDLKKEEPEAPETDS